MTVESDVYAIQDILKQALPKVRDCKIRWRGRLVDQAVRELYVEDTTCASWHYTGKNEEVALVYTVMANPSRDRGGEVHCNDVVNSS